MPSADSVAVLGRGSNSLEEQRAQNGKTYADFISPQTPIKPLELFAVGSAFAPLKVLTSSMKRWNK